MKFLSYGTLGENRGLPRLWIESNRLKRIGFDVGQAFKVEVRHDRLLLSSTREDSDHHVAGRRQGDGRRSILEIRNRGILRHLAAYRELKITGGMSRLEIQPSHRAHAVLRSRALTPPYRVLEVFCGGGTMTAALGADYQVAAGLEIEPDYADEWEQKHPEALLIQSDIRAVATSDLPEFDILAAGIPCTEHSMLGRAKKGLGGQPETGDAGDLFLPVLHMIQERMPAAVVLENVPSFGTSLAGRLVCGHLTKLGYCVETTLLLPNAEWGEIEDRKRWLLVAALEQPFKLQIPGQTCLRPAREFLDAPDELADKADAERIAGTMPGLVRHNERHAALGHGFGFSVLAGGETKLNTIPKSYHKINTGPFVSTPFGPRLLRLAEIERLHGCELKTRVYSTGVQILGQGVQTGVFREVFRQLSVFLRKGNQI